jgi:cobalt-zinc-cadmium efflux system protein
MSHHHDYNHNHGTKNIGITILLNIGITVAQVIGGLVSGSMALLSDATHNFSDVLALLISYIARKLANKKSSIRRTFGNRRAEIMASFINSATLLIISAALIIGAIDRLFNPVEIEGSIVIYLAALSILLNGLSVLLIKKDAENSMNMRSAYLHLFTDMLTSIAVLLGGFAIKFLSWYWFDPVISLGIAVYLIYSSWSLFAQSVKIIMQFAPDSVDLVKLESEICQLDGVKNLHHVHLWQLNDQEIMFEAHIDFNDDAKISEFEERLMIIGDILHQYDIRHFNIQPEYTNPDSKSLIHDH